MVVGKHHTLFLMMHNYLFIWQPLKITVTKINSELVTYHFSHHCLQKSVWSLHALHSQVWHQILNAYLVSEARGPHKNIVFFITSLRVIVVLKIKTYLLRNCIRTDKRVLGKYIYVTCSNSGNELQNFLVSGWIAQLCISLTVQKGRNIDM